MTPGKKAENIITRFVKSIFNIIAIFIGFIVFLLLKFARLFVDFKVGKLLYFRIGHLAANTELFLRRQSIKKHKEKKHFIFLSGEPANRQLLKMIKRRLPVVENKILVKVYDSIYPLTKKSDTWVDIPFFTNEYDEFSNIEPQLSFTNEEEKKGREILREIGINSGKDFVCFHARESIFFDTIKKDYNLNDALSQHDFRNCNIEGYLPAVRFLASDKIYAVRMGSVVEKELNEESEYIIDYAKRFRSDFGDIYLPAKCKFFLGNTSGIRFASVIFNVPIAFANSEPFGDISLNKVDVFIPKKLWSLDEKRLLTFREIIEMGALWWKRSDDYQKTRIEVVENTPEEILDLTKEINSRIDGTWVTKDDEIELQERFRSLFPKGCRSDGFMSKVCTEFLRKNKGLLN